MEKNSSAHPARRVLIGRIATLALALALGRTDAAPGFAGRLAAENGWTGAFAARVVEEYRRFLILAATTDAQLTPSDAVDQAWHLHMVDTRAYWQGLCRDILGRDLHHEPASGGRDDRERYRRRYAATLDLYRTVFGERAPEDIWPDPADRFSARFRRVDLTRSIVLDAGRLAWIALGIAALAVTILIGLHVLAVILLIGVALVLLGRASELQAGRVGRRTASGSDGGTAGMIWDGGGGDCGGADGGCGGGCGGD